MSGQIEEPNKLMTKKKSSQFLYKAYDNSNANPVYKMKYPQGVSSSYNKTFRVKSSRS